ncbi:MAG: hypothetical protein JXO48_06870 [Deltaproteobacteria bacterium]|nr:hypothetical protein [Deltaproteobacteria bacterium]
MLSMKMSCFFILIPVLLSAGCSVHSYKLTGDTVHLYLRKDTAREVYFASSLDGFVLHEARKRPGGDWEIVLPGGNVEFRYFYVVDGEVYVPACRFRERDDLGSENCLYVPGM